MSELAPADLSAYTQGRLSASDPNTQTVLSAALAQVRHYCQWNVCPVITGDTVTLDGPGQWGGYTVGLGALSGGSYYTGTGTLRRSRVGGNTLYLPTKRLQSISSVTEDSVALDVSTLQFSEHGEVIKTADAGNGNGLRWSVNYRSIQVTFTHGWTEAEAADWRRIVLAVADRMSLVRGLTGPFPVSIGPYRVGGYYGTSRAGNAPTSQGWLDDLFGMIDTKNYVIQGV
jgi:hypothetical protein